MAKFIKTDAWRGYSQPDNAVMGSSDTGTWSDSPAPSGDVKKELDAFRKHLRSKGISSRTGTTGSSNAFMVKRWVIVSRNDLSEGKRVAKAYLDTTTTSNIHEAD